MTSSGSNPSKYLGRELEYLEQVLAGDSWSSTGGSWTNTFERAFAKRLGTRYAIAFNSGTSTLHAALEAVGVGFGDEVISPALTVIMDTAATLHANAVPVYADIDPATFNLDPTDLERKITPRTKAVIVVALYGLPADMDRILAIAGKHGVAVIEDNAQALLSTYRGRLLGSFGQLASYSFETTKHLSCGEGGALITNDEALATAARKVGGHGFRTLAAAEGRTRLNDEAFQNPDYKRHDTLGWNYRLSEFNAAVALAQLERADELVQLRRQSARLFLEAMANCDFLTPQLEPETCRNTYYTLGACYTGEEVHGVSWRSFWRTYRAEGGDGFYGAWAVPYLEPVMSTRVFASRCPDLYRGVVYEPGLCPVAERIQPRLMQFKTNYRDLAQAASRAESLSRAIHRVQRGQIEPG